MALDAWLSFVAAAGIMLAIPGPTVTLVVSYAIAEGRRSAWSTVVGVMLGDFTAMTLSLLGLGLATPILAVVASFLHAAQIVTDPAHAKPAVALLIAVALALLGPGAYSFDARRFGRRLVVMSEHDPD